MIITTTESIKGKKIVRTLGLAKGNTIRAPHWAGHHDVDAQHRRRRDYRLH